MNALKFAGSMLFLSTLSLRRATGLEFCNRNGRANFYPRSPCGERLAYPDMIICTNVISIHALLAESDHAPNHNLCLRNNFYPRSPCGERRCARCHCWGLNEFLSTLSLRRATAYAAQFAYNSIISIHALLAESDPTSYMPAIFDILFLSTLSLRRATVWTGGLSYDDGYFYPRSPCGERRPQPPKARVLKNFYPRSPCGERPKSDTATAFPLSFLSTLSLRRATTIVL